MSCCSLLPSWRPLPPWTPPPHLGLVRHDLANLLLPFHIALDVLPADADAMDVLGAAVDGLQQRLQQISWCVDIPADAAPVPVAELLAELSDVTPALLPPGNVRGPRTDLVAVLRLLGDASATCAAGEVRVSYPGREAFAAAEEAAVEAVPYSARGVHLELAAAAAVVSRAGGTVFIERGTGALQVHLPVHL